MNDADIFSSGQDRCRCILNGAMFRILRVCQLLVPFARTLFDMTHKIGRPNIRAKYLTALVGLALTVSPAVSDEIACVICTGPDQTYRCQITGGSAEDAGVGLFCASRIASEHVHESCAAQRNVAQCDGLLVTYAYGENEAAGAIATGDTPAEPKNVDKAEPKTLGEFTKDTVEGSANAVKKAGENIGSAATKAGKATTDAIKGAGTAIGDATKKTLKCLGSALNDC